MVDKMETLTICLNEWNATLEALGQGKQTILIRKYGTTLNKFLLFPTVSYASKNNYLDSFEKNNQDFARKNALPKKDNNKTEVKYCATVEKVVEKPSQRISSLNKFHIWTNEHVKSYLDGDKKAYVWILRVYKLKNSVMSERTKGLRYANVLVDVPLEGIKPVLSDTKFSKIIENIK